MKLLKGLFHFYINSSAHVALAVVALSWVSYLEYELSPDWQLLIFIFFGSITGYNFVKYAGLAKLHHRSLARNLRFIQIFSFLVFLALIYTAFLQSREILLISTLLGVFTLLYAAPVLTRNRNLRDVSGIKILIIALVWAGVSVTLPLLDHPGISLLDKMLMFLQRTLFIIVITLPFEIRDLEFDSKHLGTIPQKIGIKKTRLLGWSLLGVILILEFLKTEFQALNFIVLLGVSLLAAAGLKLAKTRQSVYFTAFWIEAIPIVWVVLWFILQILV